ncbi:LacI family DNA-binding transcriptional regulator [Glycomyces sp. NPDC047010]|uniref:LacI family DNA-binding transcriptional regulator n=1 Tax=Glycomyces sp. NPDC047010 TaxID=3155023 RepID=UPI0033D05038
MARKVGVSTQTVSRYFTGVGYVGAETRALIAAAIEELGYRPNQSARNLRARRSNAVGVLTMGPLNYGSSGVLTGLSEAARKVGYTLLIAQLDLDFEADGWRGEVRRALEHFLSIPADGILVSTPVQGTDQIVAELDAGIPVLTVSERPHSPEASATTHSFEAARTATEHLIALGHKKILHAAGPANRNEAFERERGYRAAVDEAGLPALVAAGAPDWTAVSGFLAASAADPREFTAVFAANDEIALGFMNAMTARGLHAPEDYSIVGVDDMPSAAYFPPPLTTMRLDFRAVGADAFRMLHERITGAGAVAQDAMEPELIVRDSTAAP